jgi:hypothetical protein
MLIVVQDSQVVGETLATLFSVINQGAVSMLVIIKNAGVNTLNYRFQENTGSAWVDLGSSGSDFYNTLQEDESKSIKVTSSYPQVRMVGNASGGAWLEFSVMREADRASGGSLPILNL